MFEKFINNDRKITKKVEESEDVKVRRRVRTLRINENRKTEVILSGQDKLKVNVYIAVVHKLYTEL